MYLLPLSGLDEFWEVPGNENSIQRATSSRRGVRDGVRANDDGMFSRRDCDSERNSSDGVVDGEWRGVYGVTGLTAQSERVR